MQIFLCQLVVLTQYTLEEFKDILAKANLANTKLVTIKYNDGSTTRGIVLKTRSVNTPYDLFGFNKNSCREVDLERVFLRAKHQALMAQVLNKTQRPDNSGKLLDILTEKVDAESGFRQVSVSLSGAIGFHQVMPYSYFVMAKQGVFNNSELAPDIVTKLRGLAFGWLTAQLLTEFP